MDNNDKRESVYEHDMDDADRMDNVVDESSSGLSEASRRNRRSGNEFGLTERLTDILVEDGDDDLLIQHSCEGEDRVLQWLQALDMQVMGACRADERLKPLLKLNVSNGVVEDNLLSHISQHFEPSEVALLTRCLCVPLVSIRVGKINKQGTLLCPTSARGNLTLALLPTSNLRISFIGDDGEMERLSTIRSSPGCSSVAIEKIPADRTGRSFVLKITGDENLYFWSSEKSELLGDELIEKLKDLLLKRPSLADLTGISESRLGCFATLLRTNLGGPAITKTKLTSVISVTNPLDALDVETTASSLKLARSQFYASQEGKSNSFNQSSLGPGAISFEEAISQDSSTSNSGFRETFNLSLASPDYIDESSSNRFKVNPSEYNENLMTPYFLDSLGKSTNPPFLISSASQVSSVSSSIFSPYYCWCPPTASAMQYTAPSPQLPISRTESFSLPPLSSLLSSSSSRTSSLLAPKAPNLSGLPSINFPPFLPESSVWLPLSLPPAQQIATFTPLMCDPIVHVPVIGICSSGPGYLVSAGPAISTSLPSLLPALVNPFVPKNDTMLENSARETLRLLLSSSSQNNSHLSSVLPSVLTNVADNKSIFAAVNKGVGVSDVGAITNSFPVTGLVSLPEKTIGSSKLNGCLGQGNMVDQLEKPGSSCLEDEGSNFSNLGEGMGGLID